MLSREQYKQCKQMTKASKVNKARGEGALRKAKTSRARRWQTRREGRQDFFKEHGWVIEVLEPTDSRGNESEVQSARVHRRRWSTVKEECAIPVSQKACSH